MKATLFRSDDSSISLARKRIIPTSIFTAMAAVLFAYTPAGSALAADGATVFRTNCVTCHGENMDGNGPAGQYMNPRPRNLKTQPYKAGDTKEDIYKTVHNGLAGASMPGFPQLSEEDKRAVVDYLCEQRGGCPKKGGSIKKGASKGAKSKKKAS